MERRSRILLVLMFLAGGALWAQEKPFRYNGSGYADFGVGSCAHRVGTVSFGGGGDGFLWRGLAATGDIGYYRFVERGSQGFGVGTVGVGYHFVNRSRPGKFDPFVSAGLLGAGFSEGISAAASIGGGANYWFSRRAGLRMEFRATGFAAGEALGMFRIGFSFR
ncbi:MAG: hypothetical protein ACE15B_11020 [Bryobacteraceae bacterium]